MALRLPDIPEELWNRFQVGRFDEAVDASLATDDFLLETEQDLEDLARQQVEDEVWAPVQDERTRFARDLYAAQTAPPPEPADPLAEFDAFMGEQFAAFPEPDPEAAQSPAQWADDGDDDPYDLSAPPPALAGAEILADTPSAPPADEGSLAERLANGLRGLADTLLGRHQEASAAAAQTVERVRHGRMQDELESGALRMGPDLPPEMGTSAGPSGTTMVDRLAQAGQDIRERQQTFEDPGGPMPFEQVGEIALGAAGGAYRTAKVVNAVMDIPGDIAADTAGKAGRLAALNLRVIDGTATEAERAEARELSIELSQWAAVPGGEVGPRVIGAIEPAVARAAGRLDDVVRRPAPAAGIISRAQADDAGRVTDEIAPTFYSQLQRTIEEKMPNRATADQVRGILRGSPVKPDEIKWTGFDDFLREKGSAPITKQEALDYLKQNEVRVEEVVKGDLPPVVAILAKDIENTYGMGGGAKEVRDLLNAPPGSVDAGMARRLWGDRVPELREQVNAAPYDPTKFGTYQIPGGENYRELLLTLPEKSPSMDAQARFETATARLTAARDAGDERAIQVALRDQTAARSALVNEMPSVSDTYRSSHWDEPNILAHVRFNERIDAQGKRVLFVEEVQSDWHQAGRKQGYQRKLTPAEITERQYLNMLPDKVRTPEQTDRLNELFRAGSGVPDAPFQKTWPELAMKRVVRWAAENDFDKVAWATGAQQAERYDLSKQVGEIIHSKNPDGTINLIVKDGSGYTNAYGDAPTILQRNNMTPSEVDATLGREMLQKIDAGEGVPSWVKNGGLSWQSLQGDALRIGGAGMKGFYDRMLPEVMNKLGKKFGARVGTVPISTGAQELWEVSGPGVSTMTMPEESIARAMAERLGGKVRRIDQETVHAIDITPAMKESVLTQGQPLFLLPGDDPISRNLDGTMLVGRTVGSGVGAAYEESQREGSTPESVAGSFTGGMLTGLGGEVLRRGVGANTAGRIMRAVGDADDAARPGGVPESTEELRDRAVRDLEQGIPETKSGNYRYDLAEAKAQQWIDELRARGIDTSEAESALDDYRSIQRYTVDAQGKRRYDDYARDADGTEGFRADKSDAYDAIVSALESAEIDDIDDIGRSAPARDVRQPFAGLRAEINPEFRDVFDDAVLRRPRANPLDDEDPLRVVNVRKATAEALAQEGGEERFRQNVDVIRGAGAGELARTVVALEEAALAGAPLADKNRRRLTSSAQALGEDREYVIDDLAQNLLDVAQGQMGNELADAAAQGIQKNGRARAYEEYVNVGSEIARALNQLRRDATVRPMNRIYEHFRGAASETDAILGEEGAIRAAATGLDEGQVLPDNIVDLLARANKMLERYVESGLADDTSSAAAHERRAERMARGEGAQEAQPRKSPKNLGEQLARLDQTIATSEGAARTEYQGEFEGLVEKIIEKVAAQAEKSEAKLAKLDEAGRAKWVEQQVWSRLGRRTAELELDARDARPAQPIRAELQDQVRAAIESDYVNRLVTDVRRFLPDVRKYADGLARAEGSPEAMVKFRTEGPQLPTIVETMLDRLAEYNNRGAREADILRTKLEAGLRKDDLRRFQQALGAEARGQYNDAVAEARQLLREAAYVPREMSQASQDAMDQMQAQFREALANLRNNFGERGADKASQFAEEYAAATGRAIERRVSSDRVREMRDTITALLRGDRQGLGEYDAVELIERLRAEGTPEAQRTASRMLDRAVATLNTGMIRQLKEEAAAVLGKRAELLGDRDLLDIVEDLRTIPNGGADAAERLTTQIVRSANRDAMREMADQARRILGDASLSGYYQRGAVDAIDGLFDGLREFGQEGAERAERIQRGLIRSGLLRYAGKDPDARARLDVTVNKFLALSDQDVTKPEVIRKLLLELRKDNPVDAWIEYNVLNVLSNPELSGPLGSINTLSNILSASARLGAYVVDDLVFDPIAATVTGERTAPVASAALMGARAALPEAGRMAVETWRKGYVASQFMDQARLGEFQYMHRERLTELGDRAYRAIDDATGNRVPGLDFLRQYGNPGRWAHLTVTRPMAASDLFVGHTLFMAEAAGLAERKARTLSAAGTPTTADDILRTLWTDHPDIVKEAGKVRDYSLLRENGPVVKALNRFARSDNAATRLAAHYVAMFTTVPTNAIIQGALHYSPVAVGYEPAKQLARAMFAKEKPTQREVVESMRRVSIGMSLGLWGWSQYEQGNLKGSGKVEGHDDRFGEDAPFGPAWRVNGKWVPLNGTPLGIPLGIVADAFEARDQARRERMDNPSATDLGKLRTSGPLANYVDLKDLIGGPVTAVAKAGVRKLQEDEEVQAVIRGMATGVLGNAAAIPWVRSVSALASLSEPNAASGGTAFAASAINRSAPAVGMLSWLAALGDLYQRHPEPANAAEGGIVESIRRRVAQNIPGQRGTVPVKMIATGQKVPEPRSVVGDPFPQGPAQALGQYAFPIAGRIMTPLEDRTAELYRRYDVPLSAYSDEFRDIELNAQQQRNVQHFYGQFMELHRPGLEAVLDGMSNELAKRTHLKRYSTRMHSAALNYYAANYDPQLLQDARVRRYLLRTGSIAAE